MRCLPVIALPLALLALPGCQKEDREAQARRDARDVAMVRAAQNVPPPIAPLVPQGLAPSERAGPCRFSDPARASGQPILSLGPTQALLRSSGQLETLAADPSSTKLAQGFWTRYTGKVHALKLEPQPTLKVPTPAGFSPAANQPAAMTVTDANERKVLEAVGDLTCG